LGAEVKKKLWQMANPLSPKKDKPVKLLYFIGGWG
jgi:hypothetical protein